ncbi:MAG: radical SAM protein [Spirochaetaceae bacterium]|nr:MAG: radical SAM protein [Spirochaetaceae bacterium]
MLNSTSILSYGLQTLLLRRQMPLLASFKVTYHCNLRCTGCPYHRRAREPGAKMSWQQALEVLSRLERLGCRIVIFEGGEPLLWTDGNHDFSDLAEKARTMFLKVGVTTNGTISLDVPTDLLWVSLDGARDQHNRSRDISFDRALQHIKSSTHRCIYIHYTVNRENIDDIPVLAGVLASEANIRGITFQFFYPYNQGELDLALRPAEREQAVRTILKLKRSGKLPVLNSSASLKRMIKNTWRCRSWTLANVDPDGSLWTGCYLQQRGEIRCRHCGFTPVAEASLALGLHPGALLAGRRIFFAN